MSFFNRYKKIFLVIIFLLVVFALGYLLWRFFFQESFVEPGITPISTSTPGGLPGIGPGGEIIDDITGPGRLPGFDEDGQPIIGTPIGQPSPEASAPSLVADGGLTQIRTLVPSPVLNPTITSDGRVQYYDKNDGHFYRIDENGNIIKMSDRVFHQVQQVTWAPNSQRAILEYPDDTKIMYDFSAQRQVTLPSYWKDFSFADNSEQIVAKSIGLDPNNRWLIVAGSDGSKATAIEPIGTADNTVYPSWSPNNQIVAMYTKGVDFDMQEIFFVGMHGENFKSTIVEGRGIQTAWSQTGNSLLYSAYHSRDEYRPRLWIVEASGDNIGANRRSLELNTWANKCTFATENEVYCAVPENLEAGAGMFPELADRTKDNLYKIDLTTGARSLIAVPAGAYNISQLMVPQNQNYLYFTDKSTEMIHQVRLR